MKNIIFSITFLFFCITFLEGQVPHPKNTTPLQQLVKNSNFTEQTEMFNLFEQRAISKNNDFTKEVSYYEVFDLHEDILNQILVGKPDKIKLLISFQEKEYMLLLVKNNPFSENFIFRTEKGQVINSEIPNEAFYKGIIEGENTSIATAAFFENEVRVCFSDEKSNYRFTHLKDGNYIAYKDIDLLNTPDFNCGVNDEPFINDEPDDPKSDFTKTTVTSNCQYVEIFFECDFAFYQAEGSSVNAVKQQVAAIFNEVQTIYFNESIPIAISDILVWTIADPYVSFNNTEDALYGFKDYRDGNYNGRLAHLLSTRFLGGGRAWLDVLCSNDLQYGVSSGIATWEVSPFPNYSWSVEVIAHELGHNFGSRHTQWCGWNGGPIDNCATQENDDGSCSTCCSAGPTPTNGGTIMSYCDNVVGINFNNGFGTQPGNKIRSEFANASCFSGCYTWVDYDTNGFENGSFNSPWNTLIEAVNIVADQGTIIIKSSTGTETPLINVNKSFIIRTWEGNSTVGQ